MRQPSHRFVPAKGIKEDAPHHREGSTPCLHDLRTSPFPFVVPRQNDLSLKVHGLNFVAGANETHNEGKVDSTLSALTSTTHNIRLFLERLPPLFPPPGGGGDTTTQEAEGSRTLARARVLNHHLALSSESFARRKFFSPVHFS